MATIKSIKEKAKAYDEALKVLHKYDGANIMFTQDLKEEMFPELKESEDEKIRKELITHCRNTRCVTEEGAERIVKWISWLEKQGNLMKALQISNARIGELIEKNYYLKEQLEKQGNSMSISEATKQELEDNLNKALEKETPESWNKFLEEQGEQKPTDKIESRQEELTEFEKAVKQVMEEAIECGDTHNLKADADMLLRLVQKPDWSEEDIELLDNTIKFIEDRVAATSPSLRTYSPTLTGKEIPFLKALKDRVQPKQEWSEEDNRMSRFIGNAITVDDASIYLESKGIQVIDAHVWLNGLKDRYAWRPSDEQMKALNIAMCGVDDPLFSLYQDLKKLKD